MAAKRSCDDMDVEPKKQCTFQEEFADALEQVQQRALEDRDYLVKKACEFYVQRNEKAPSVDELEKVFQDLAEKFTPEDAESESESEQDDESDSSSDDEEENVESFADFMANGEVSEFKGALEDVAKLAQAKKAELKDKVAQLWKQQEGSDITAEESEAVFALVGSIFKNGADYEIDEENDADYELTEQDKQMDKEDAEVEEEEEELEKFQVKLDGELKFTKQTTSMKDVEKEAVEEAFGDQIEATVAKQLLQIWNKFIPEADADDVTDSFKAAIDQSKNAEDKPEEEFDESEVEKSEFMKAATQAFTDANGYAPSAEDKAKIIDAWANQESEDESESESESAADSEDAEYTSKSRPTGSIEKQSEELQQKHANAMDVDESAAVDLL